MYSIIDKIGNNLVNKMGDKIINKISEILKENINRGLTITELVKISKLSRSAIRTALSELKGAGKVSVRKIGMAKVYFLKPNKKIKKK